MEDVCVETEENCVDKVDMEENCVETEENCIDKVDIYDYKIVTYFPTSETFCVSVALV